ncbi:hypothetical protein CROQUDRAFT_642718 [Cronartium quercuum f. sp. fusiforme G11]|uniref:Uncharacterized protein n=1 Tax=Cronartium quercuum f. sp. fusiforme G11 TaxID=708437 RepID=A0A9P6TAZ7_9BASI|nr:hypothetical protein CROQUDRAFT_642718 [Cronartium quercuum f. sp. fusiforme G11]
MCLKTLWQPWGFTSEDILEETILTFTVLVVFCCAFVVSIIVYGSGSCSKTTSAQFLRKSKCHVAEYSLKFACRCPHLK